MTNFIHQTLHGYQNGHKLIFSTLELPANAKNILLRESDSPNEAFHNQEDVCFSGYPISEAGVYVLSKTWVATEIKRPGCVWTHSLLIPFSFLAKRSEIVNLDFQALFLSENKKIEKIELTPLDILLIKKRNETKNLSDIFSQIFKDNEQAILDRNSVSFDDIIYIWSKLWPRMRRTFSFKTWAPKKIPKSSNYSQYDLVLVKDKDKDKDKDKEINQENWSIDFFDINISLHNFTWKYGASVDDKKGNVFNLYNAWLLHEKKQKDALVDFLLRWDKCPIPLVKDIIKEYSTDPLSLKFSYLVSKYILTLDENSISESVVSDVGALISKEDKNFFLKVIKSEFLLKKYFVSRSLNCLGGNDLVFLINNQIVDTGNLTSNEILSISSFWEDINDKEHLLKDVLDKKLLSNDCLINIANKMDLSSLDIDTMVSMVMISFDIDRISHKNIITKESNLVIRKINQDVTLANDVLSEFIMDTYSISYLSLLNDKCLCALWLNSGRKTEFSIKILKVICSDLLILRPQSLEMIFDDILNKSNNNDLKYLEMVDIRGEINSYFKHDSVLIMSLMELFSYFVEKYMTRYSLYISENMEYNLKKAKPIKENKKKTYKFFWF